MYRGLENKREINLVDTAGKCRPATISLSTHHRSEGGFSRRECNIHLVSEELNIHASAFDYFDAFCRIREQLAAHGFYPLCYGASRSVYPSSLCRDMSEGLIAYKHRVGTAVRPEDQVNIFDTGPEVEVATVAEQQAFYLAFISAFIKEPSALKTLP